MTEYRLHVQSVYDRADGYGISVVENGAVLRIVRDVSLDREMVEALVGCFNRYGLEPEHLDQAIEDFLYDFTVPM